MRFTQAFSLLLLLSLAANSFAEPPFKIGAVLSLSGPNYYMGSDFRDGIKLCSESPERFIFEDSQSQPSIGLSAFNKLVSFDQVKFALVSLSNVAAAIVPVAKTKKIPLALTVVSGRSVVQASDQLVDFYTLAEREAQIFAQFAAQTLGSKRIAILYIESEYGLAYKEGFEKELRNSGGELVYGDSFVFDTTDFRTQLMRARAATPDLIYLVGFDRHIINMLRQAKELKLESKLASVWTITAPAFRAGNEDIFEGVYCTSPEFYTAPNEEARTFSTKFSKSFGREPTVYALTGCDVASLVDRYGKDSAAELLVALQNLKDFNGISGRLNAEERVISTPLQPAQIQNGKVTSIARN